MDWKEKITPGQLYGCQAIPEHGAPLYIAACLEPGNIRNGLRVAYVCYDTDGDETGWGRLDPGKNPDGMDLSGLLLPAAEKAVGGNYELRPLPDGVTPYSLRRGQTVYLVTDRTGRDTFLAMQWSDNEAASENCDACVAYWVFDGGMLTELDGGEMDYDSGEKAYVVLADALDDVLDFAYGPDRDGWEISRAPDLCLEDLGL